MPIKPDAFIAIEETMAHTLGLEWYETLAPYMSELIDVIGMKRWSEAHSLIDSIRFDALVDHRREAVEELAVTALLFGAANVKGEPGQTSFATGRQPIPPGLQQAIDHLSIIAQRSSAETVCNQLHKAIAALEEEEKLVAVGKEDMGQADIDAAGRSSPEQTPFLKSLYVHRTLINSAEVLEWARKQGFKSVLEQGDLHVTVCFSRDPMDWNEPEPGEPEVTVVGGRRSIEQFGKATVLSFDSPDLQKRHSAFREAGASHDFPDYRPHLTLTYDASEVNLAEIEPFSGDLLFGPEEFSVIKDDWSDGVQEHLLKAEGQTLAQMLNAAVLDGKKMVDVGANLTTSRLVTLGFLAEAVDSQLVEYQVNEVLDDVTCEVCRFMHGKTFKVEQEYSKLITTLGTSDPSELKHLSPWPKNTREGLAQLRSMSPEEMQAAGYGSPPYHPGCRGFPSLVGTVNVEEVATVTPDEPVTVLPAVALTPGVSLLGSITLSSVKERRLRRRIAALGNTPARQAALDAYAEGGAAAARAYLETLSLGS